MCHQGLEEANPLIKEVLPPQIKFYDIMTQAVVSKKTSKKESISDIIEIILLLLTLLTLFYKILVHNTSYISDPLTQSQAVKNSTSALVVDLLWIMAGKEQRGERQIFRLREA